MSYRTFGLALTVACALFGTRAALAGCGTCDKTVVENAVNNENFSTLVAAVKAAGLAETLSGSGPFTVFAPTNAAFEKLPAGTVEKLLKPENKGQLVKVLTYHVVPGKVMAKDVVKLNKATTVEGSDVAIAVSGGTVTVDNAKEIDKYKSDISNLESQLEELDSQLISTLDELKRTSKKLILSSSKVKVLEDQIVSIQQKHDEIETKLIQSDSINSANEKEIQSLRDELANTLIELELSQFELELLEEQL